MGIIPKIPKPVFGRTEFTDRNYNKNSIDTDFSSN
jgi:hypothetical protein